MSFFPPPSGHGEELLSALADDELLGDERAWTESHLLDCPDCRSEYDAVIATRAALRTMPPVPADDVIGAFLARHRRLIHTGLVFVGAAAMVLGALSLTAAVIVEPVVPDIDALVDAHERDVAEAMTSMKMRAVDSVRGPYVAPAQIGAAGGLSRHAVFDGHDLTSVVYRSDSTHVSVFELPGRVDWSHVPDGQRLLVRADREAWRRDGSPVVLMADVGHLVVVVVSDDEDAALAAMTGLPEAIRNSWQHHLHDAGQRLADVFSFHG